MDRNEKLIWIDLDNSPHVPFFRPIIDELHLKGYKLLLTARDAYQVNELTRLHKIQCITIGRHFGKNKFMKAIGLLLRTIQLMPLLVRHRPTLAVSHGSRAQILAAKLMAIRSVVIADYEHVTHITRPDWIVVPEVIPTDSAGKFARHVLKYPGIKEDVYASTFSPDSKILDELGLTDEDVIVTLRPPATEAHYHNPASEQLFTATIDLVTAHPTARIVLLPRNQRQKAEITRKWPHWIETRKIIIPDEAVDGLNLVWHSDLVISGGGTMNREAAALGVPVYSIFRGSIGAVDAYLAKTGRMILLESVDDVQLKVSIAKRSRKIGAHQADRSALHAIVDDILAVASNKEPISVAG